MRTFSGEELREIAFPLGGIGAGTVSLGGGGNLRDWEIFGRPAKGRDLPNTFFALRAGGVAKVLERRLFPPYRGGHGFEQDRLGGLPRLKEARFLGEYPFARIEFEDEDLPVRARLEAWSPFIPHEVEPSALPLAVLEWTFENRTRKPVELLLAFSVWNPVGSGERGTRGKCVNEFVEESGLRGLRLSSEAVSPDEPEFGTLAVATDQPDVLVQTHWVRAGWFDSAHRFWDGFSAGRIEEGREKDPSPEGRSDVASLYLRTRARAGKEVSLRIYLAWHFPNGVNYWNREEAVKGKPFRRYAARWSDAWDVIRKAHASIERLERATRAWHGAFYGSTLPAEVLDAAGAQVSTIRTNTCFLDEGGGLFGFEGCSDTAGSCPLNCTHVWNYSQTESHLFPALARFMRETDYHNLRPDGSMAFRTLYPLCESLWQMKPAADGQMGTIVRTYREWKLSGDTEWLKRLWPRVRRSMKFAWEGWDADKDGLMEGEQHNTYDIEFYGKNPVTSLIYLAALKCCAEMAQACGEETFAGECRDVLARGRENLEQLWNGEYYVQDEAAAAAHKYQFGRGCLADQLLGEWFARASGAGAVLDDARVKKVMKTLFKHSFLGSFERFANVQRVYALNDEPGLLLCSWPRGGRPAIPFPYSDEVWTGIEYAVASLMLHVGMEKEALEIVRAARSRYDGSKRNPWNEIECGHHYVRAMSSWGLVRALTGFECDMTLARLGFRAGAGEKRFRCFYSTGLSWGVFERSEKARAVEGVLSVLHGRQPVKEFVLGWKGKAGKVSAEVSGKGVQARVGREKGALVLFFDGVDLGGGESLRIRIRKA